MRLLFVCHWPWWLELGGARHFIELAQELERQGHSVDRVSATAAHVRPRSPMVEALRPPFSRLIRDQVARVASRYDVIDALEGDLPFSKEALGFDGLLVARSVGLSHAFQEFLDFSRRRWPDQDLGHPIGQALRELIRRRRWPDFERSWHCADLISLSNPDELPYLRAVGAEGKAFVSPLGLTPARHAALAEAAAPPGRRLARREIAFVGYWYPRKGSLDYGEIVRRVRAEVPDARFLFLGTWLGPEQVLRDLRLEPADWIRVVPKFRSDELPSLLSEVTVGAFPSYAEGFGFVVLEQLAAGVPTVAYDIPGPREMLRGLGRPLMVARGDTAAFAERLTAILRSDEPAYRSLGEGCAEVAARFRWADIARRMADVYAQRLSEVPRGGAPRPRSSATGTAPGPPR